MGASWVDAAIILIMAVLTSYLHSELGLLGFETESRIAGYYFDMVVITAFIMIAAEIGFAFFAFKGASANPKETLPRLIIGAIAGTLVTATGLLAFKSLITTPGAIDPNVGVLFVVGVATFVETYFFWCALYPSIKKAFGERSDFAMVAAAIFAGVLFAGWHVVARNGDFSGLFDEFVYSSLSIALLEYTKGAEAPTAAHVLRNLITGG